MDNNLSEDNQAVKPEKLDLRSHDMAKEKRQELLRLFPEIRTEGGKIDIERLKLALGETVDVGKERYGMNWPGKADCFKTIQMPSLGTLRPCPEESVNFDTTENLIIEGDNLEVLKLLQKSYLGKIKMIYIDPPYNTGNDFIYPDNYSESLQTYLEYTGQVDAEGRKFGTNTDTDGRFHSKWLNMMYPRLYLARNLLREDGVIFISIDDHEVDNLRKLCNEVYGEENFLASVCWQKKYAPANDKTDFSTSHDYVIVYAKIRPISKKGRVQSVLSKEQRSDEMDRAYANPDNDPRGAWKPGDYTCNKSAEERPNLYFPIVQPTTGEEIWPKKARVWAYSREYHDQNVKASRVWWGQDGRNRVPSYKRFLSEVSGIVAQTVWLWEEVGHTDESKKELKAIFQEAAELFDTPKPTRLMQKMLSLGSGQGTKDIILDFFAGSGTTAHAVLDLNKQDGGNRKFILVQLPEPTGRTDYPTIADICNERVRRVIKKLNDDDLQKSPQQSLALTPTPALPLKWGGSGSSVSSNIKNMPGGERNRLKSKGSGDIVPSPCEGEGQDGGADVNKGNSPDRGFKVFKLAESNFNPWNANVPHEAMALEQQLDLHVDHIREGRTAEDLLFEILLKSGYPLTTSVESLQLAGKFVHSIDGGVFFICLERELTMELIRAMAEKKPERVVCLDEGFADNDQLKANAVQIFKTKGITSFKTV